MNLKSIFGNVFCKRVALDEPKISEPKIEEVCDVSIGGEQESKPKTRKVSELSIRCTQITYSFTVDTDKMMDSYRSFYTWFFCRESEAYSIFYKDGVLVLQRKHIIDFEIKLKEISCK
jgi:hypothetical protein